MLSATIEAKQKRAWIWGGYRSTIHVALGSRQHTIPVAALFERILEASPSCQLVLQQAEVRDENGHPVHIVRNLRGRPMESFPEHLQKGRGEEMFFSSGVLKPVPRHPHLQEKQEEEELPFSFEVRSEFKQFAPQAVEHRLVANHSHALRPVVEDFEIQLLPKLVPAEVEHIRFGIEHFRQTLTGGLASFTAPNIHQRFYLEINSSSITVCIEEEFGGHKNRIPDFEGNLIRPLDFALDSLDLFVGLENSLCAKLT